MPAKVVPAKSQIVGKIKMNENQLFFFGLSDKYALIKYYSNVNNEVILFWSLWTVLHRYRKFTHFTLTVLKFAYK